jgi:hypothetical protein
VAAINVLKGVAICFQGAHAPPFDKKHDEKEEDVISATWSWRPAERPFSLGSSL